MRVRTKAQLACIFASIFSACVANTETNEEANSPDGADDNGIAMGKADGSLSDCQMAQIVEYLNGSSTTLATLRAANVYSTAAKNIIAHRDGADRKPGTSDDNLFDDIEEVDAVRYVGVNALRALGNAVSGECAGHARMDTIFSPQAYAASHLTRVASMIDGAHTSIDAAIYSFSDAAIFDALKRAVDRGVTVRVIYDPASKEKSRPTGTQSERLENIGVDVRYVNQTMHHKFMIVDGARSSAAEAANARISTGSANWSNGAGTKFDDNTTFIQDNAELALRFQQEFNHLWENSRDFEGQAPEYFESLRITDAMIASVDDPNIETFYTSANFQTSISNRYGNTFSVDELSNVVSDRLVTLIEGARTSIDLASGHLRSWPVVEALLKKHRENPEVAIRVYLDQQEYISASGDSTQQAELQDCLTEAGDDERGIAACYDTGILYSRELVQAGIDVRYKFYAYRWDFSYAPQMHHKYFIVDGNTIASGSYNLSDNAEHGTMENMVIYHGAGYPEVVQQFQANFNAIWNTGAQGNLYDELMETIDGSNQDFPLVFAPMALTWQQVTALKTNMRSHCSAIDSDEYRSNAAAHRFCAP